MSAAPILDLEVDPPAPKSKRLSILLGLLIGAGIGLTLAVRTEDTSSPNLLPFIPALYVAIAVHELGHLLAGRMVGMSPGGIVLGGFRLMKSGGHYSFTFDYRQLLGGGMALVLTRKNQFTPRQFAFMVAGGPLASLALTLLCGIVSLRLGGGPWVNTLFWVALLTMASLIPASAGINRTDGARLWQLLRHPARAKTWIALVAMQSEEKRGVLPRDWDPELVESVCAAEPCAAEYTYCQLMMFYRQLNLGDEAGAIQHLENALAGSASTGKLVRHCYFLEAAGASADLRKRPGNARIWLERARKLRKPDSTHGTEAAIALCEERYADALIHLNAAREHMRRRKLDSGIARFAMEQLDKAEALCRRAKVSLPAS